MKKFPFLLLLLLSVFLAFGQNDEKSVSADLSVDLVSRYVWRGINLSESPAIQPAISINYKGLSFGTWASYTFSREALQEVDLFLSYQTRFVTFTLNNYYNPVDSLGFAGNYFELSGSRTPHILEGLITLNGPENFPVSLTAATMFWGNDRDADDKNLFSTYLELAYPFAINENQANIFLGVTPANGFYYNKFGLVNLGLSVSKDIKITDTFSLPIKGSFCVNPALEKVFLIFSITL